MSTNATSTQVGEYTPTVHLRFVERGGARILQQLFQAPMMTTTGVLVRFVGEWRDVPLVGEESHPTE